MASANGLRQPSRREPLRTSSFDRTEALGIVGLRCRVILHLDSRSGRMPVPFSFVVDSGASYSLISLELAELREIPVPPPESEIEIPLRTTKGTSPTRVRPGRVRVWWDEEMNGYPFDWPVLFRVDSPFGVPSILGLGGIVKTCRWTFDGSYSPNSPYGYLTLDDIR